MNGPGRLGALLLAVCLLTAGHARGGERLPPVWRHELAQAGRLPDPGERVVRISALFLGTPYRAQTLGGGAGVPERLRIVLDAVDCFTLLDYVEALRRTADPAEFPTRLAEVRYRERVIAWETRRHFFTDWAQAPEGRIADVTTAVGGAAARQADKQLNRRADGTLLLPGIAVQARRVSFVPAVAVSGEVLGRLRSGDYLGIYAEDAGLDVTHVGIVVRREGRLLLRHASSRREAGRVIDSDLSAYLAGKPGIVVLRPL